MVQDVKSSADGLDIDVLANNDDTHPALVWLWRLLSWALQYVAVFLGLNGLVKSFDDFGLIKLQQDWGALGYLYIAGAALVCIILFDKLKKLYYQSALVLSQYTGIKRDLILINNDLWQIARENSYFKIVYARWRIENERSKIRRIAGSYGFLPVRRKYEYLVSVFEGIIGRIDGRVKYETLSNIEFWYAVLCKSNNNFLHSSQTAMSKGVSMRRFILVDESKLRRVVTYQDKVIAICDVLEKLESDRILDLQRLKLTFHICDYRYMQEKVDVPYAVLSIDSGKIHERMAIMPNIDDDNARANVIQVHFDRKELHSKFNKLVEAIDEVEKRNYKFDFRRLKDITTGLRKDPNMPIPAS